MNLDAKARISFTVNDIEIQLKTPEEAIKLLRVMQLFDAGSASSVIIEPSSSQKPARKERVVTESRTSHILMDEKILLSLRGQFGSKYFTYQEAEKQVLQALGRRGTTIKKALARAVKDGQLYKITKGVYAFGETTSRDYEPDPNSLIDIVTPESSTFLELLQFLTSYSDGINLYFSADDGMMTRFSTADKSMILEVRVPGAFFSTYHVKNHVQLGLYASDQAKRPANSSEPFHLTASEGQTFLKAGPLGNEQQYKILELKSSESEFTIEKDLVLTGVKATAMIPRIVLEEVFTDAVHVAERVQISFSKDVLHIQSAGPSDNYVRYTKFLTPVTNDISIPCAEPCRGIFDVASLKDAVCAKAVRPAEALTIKLIEGMLVLEANVGKQVLVKVCFLSVPT
jgi:hypothetical protein